MNNIRQQMERLEKITDRREPTDEECAQYEKLWAARKAALEGHLYAYTDSIYANNRYKCRGMVQIDQLAFYAAHYTTENQRDGGSKVAGYVAYTPAYYGDQLTPERAMEVAVRVFATARKGDGIEELKRFLVRGYSKSGIYAHEVWAANDVAAKSIARPILGQMAAGKHLHTISAVRDCSRDIPQSEKPCGCDACATGDGH